MNTSKHAGPFIENGYNRSHKCVEKLNSSSADGGWNLVDEFIQDMVQK